MFDETEEDEREIRRLQRGELFRRPKPKLPEQQEDVMERREFDRLLDQIVYGTDTQTRIDAKAQAIREHAALVEQRDLLVAALREIQEYRNTSMICLNSDDDTELETEYRQGARAAADNVAVLATRALTVVEQGEGRES